MASQHDSIPLGFFCVSAEASAGFALQTLATGSATGSQSCHNARTVGARSSRQNIPTRNVAKNLFSSQNPQRKTWVLHFVQNDDS
jgi:hypothetical protein